MYAGLPAQSLLEAMTHDKKSLNGVVRFVLLKSIGEVAFHQQVPFEAVQTLLAEYA
jgi:3-dehydroquinate synthetase